MSYPYSNYNNSNAWDKGRQPQALQDLLKLQQQLQGQTSNVFIVSFCLNFVWRSEQHHGMVVAL